MKLTIMFSAILLTLLFDFAFGGERIYGGHPIHIKEAPYMVHVATVEHFEHGVQISGCGGSILRPNLILTAGHCTKKKNGELNNADIYQIHVGSTHKNGGTIHKVKKIHTHPNYTGRDTNWHHDISVLELIKDIELNERAQLVNLTHNDDKPAIGTDVVVSGWGKNPEHPNDKRLYQVHLEVVSVQQCKDYYEHKDETIEELEQHEICAKAKSVGKDCPGDSGGPLIDTTNNRQIGTVSYGRGGCTVSSATVFCRVADNLDFIEKIIKKTKRCPRH